MVPTLTFAVHVVAALLLGVVIGIERQWRQRMAGLRTNALVAVGSAIFASLSILMDAKVNPTMVAGYIVAGIGFLAGAVIFREGFNVRGLNTAATLWATAAVGTLCGSGFLAEAALAALAVLSANVLLRPIAQLINRQPLGQSEVSQAYQIAVASPAVHEESVRAAVLDQIRATTMHLRSIESHNADNGRARVAATVMASERADIKLERIVGHLSRNPNIVAASWRVATVAAEDEVLEAGSEE